MDVRGRLLPATTATARYSWYTDAQTTNVDLPQELVEQIGETPVVTVRDAENGTVNGTIALPIDISGELYHGLLAAQAGYRGEQARVCAVTLEQQLAVVRAYFQLLEALRLRDVAAGTAAVYREQVAIADDRYRNGRLTKNDLLTFQVALRNAEQAILSRGVQIDRRRLELNDAIGADVDRATDPVDVRTHPPVPSAEAALQVAWRRNPLLISLLEEQQRLEEAETSLARGRFPRFQGGGAVDYQSSDLLQPPQIGSGFVGFSWDLGTDLRRESQISAARAEAQRNRVALERQMRELEAAVRSTQLAAQERVAAYDTAAVAVGQAEENLRIRREQFDVGRAQSDDVLIAERLLATERATLASALYQAHTRKAELQRLMGLPIGEE
jgi:outer membrane protein TolC